MSDLEDIVFTPPAHFNNTLGGPLSGTLSLSDGSATTTDEFSIDVVPVNDAPVATSASFSIAENTSTTFDLSTLVSDVELSQGGTITFDVDSDASGMGVDGSWTYSISSTGQLMFTAADNFVGEVEIDFTGIDSGDGFDDPMRTADDPLPFSGTLTVLVAAQNDAPTIDSDISDSMEEDTTYNLSDLSIVIDDADVNETVDGEITVKVSVDTGSIGFPDGYSATVEITTDGDDNVVGAPLMIEFKGSLSDVDDAVNDLVFVPDQDFNGDVSLTIFVSDNGNTGAGGVLTATQDVTITVTPVNDAPTGGDDEFTGFEDTTITGNVLGNDSDVDDDNSVLTVSSVDATGLPGSLTVESNGDFTYVPLPNDNGVFTFTYTVADDDDPAGVSEDVTVTLNVLPFNDAPIANDDAVSVDEDSTAMDGDNTFTLLLDNDDDGDMGDSFDLTSITVVDQATNGTAVANDDGTITYVPNANFEGTDTFTYTIADTGGLVSNEATVTVTVNPVNDAPVGESDSYTVAEDTTLSVSAAEGVLANDSDIDGDAITAVLFSPPSNGLISPLFSDGGFNYTPNDDFTGEDTFEYRVRDSEGVYSDPVTVTITVINENDDPDSVDSSLTVDEDDSETIDILAIPGVGDADGDTLTVSIEDGDGPSNGSVSVDGSVVTYTPDPDYNGLDSFTYTLSDGNGGTATGVISVTVEPVADAPVAVDDDYTTPEDTELEFNVLNNDFDPDDEEGTESAVNFIGVVSGGPTASQGVLDSDGGGGFTFTPATDFNGTVTFVYEISDGDASTPNDTATVTITVTPVNDDPVASDETFNVTEDEELEGTLTASDADGDTLTFTLGDNTVQNGVLSEIDSEGNFTYTPK